MRLGCNCSVEPLQAKLKIISEADGVGRVWWPLPNEREKPNGVSQREARPDWACWAYGWEFS